MINGRYYTRNGEIVDVHDNVGKLVKFDVDDKCLRVVGVEYGYDDNGNCLLEKLDLVQRVNPQSVDGQMRIEGCEMCNG